MGDVADPKENRVLDCRTIGCPNNPETAHEIVTL